ncbi:hypothetical protein [Methanosarcina sp.]
MNESYVANGIIAHNCISALISAPITIKYNKLMLFK